MEEFDTKETTEPTVETEPAEAVTPETEEPVTEATLMTWETERFVKTDQAKPSNQIALFAIVGLLVVYAIWQRQLILGILVVAVVGFWFLLKNSKPGDAKVVLTTKGIRLGDHFWPYADLVEFNTDKEVYPATLMVRHKSRLYPDLKFQLKEVDPEAVSKVLSQYLPKSEGKDFRDDLIGRMGL